MSIAAAAFVHMVTASWRILNHAIGAKSYGRAPNFLMATGYEQARSVVAAIAGDIVAADNLQLTLPQTAFVLAGRVQMMDLAPAVAALR